MLTSKQTTLKPLLESKEGIHLTIYLVNRGHLVDLKSQLRDRIKDACEWLNNAMSPKERVKFLEPLHALLNDSRILKQMKGNIGIFRNEEVFRILNIPIDVEQSCQVATSFHVKPLLRWLQGGQEFLLLGLEKEAAHLYQGSEDCFKLVDSVLFPEFFKTKDLDDEYTSLKKSRLHRERAVETFAWLNDWIQSLTESAKPRLFLAGEESLLRPLTNSLKYKNAVRTPIANSFASANAVELCRIIRKILKEESKKNLEKTLLEFRFAEEIKRVRKNIFQISRAVVQGKVCKLIITDELSIFGKIDPKTGGIAIHPFDLDHEDDCILDDLAQMVLNQGGEVIVAKRDEIPKGRPILAILDDDGENLEKTEGLHYEVLEERSG